MFMVNIKLRELELEGFRSYFDRCKVTFSDGVNIIVGKNGAGKTTLIEAIYYALTTDTFRGSKEDLFNARKKGSFIVKLVIDSDRGNIKIERERPNTMGDKLLIGNNVYAIGSNTVNSKIAELFGIGKYTENKQRLTKLLKTVFVSQGELLKLSDILSSDSKEKKEQIDAQLGLNDYEEAYKKLGDYGLKVRYDGRMRVYKITDNDYKNLQDDVLELERKLKERENEYKQKEEELSRVLTELSRLRREKEMVEETISNLKESLKQLEEKKKKYEELVSSKKTLISELSRKQSLATEIMNKIINLKNKGISNELVSNFSLLKDSIDMRAEIKDAIDILEKIEELTNQNSNTLNELMSHGLSLKFDKTDLHRYRDDMIIIRDRQEKNKMDLVKLKEELDLKTKMLKELLLKAKEIHEGLIELDVSDDNICTAIAQLNNAYKELLSNLTKSEVEVKLLTERLESLSRTIGSCPICGNPMTEEHKERLINETKAQLQRVKLALDETKSKRDKLDDIITKINSEVSRIKSLQEDIRKKEKEVEEIEKIYGDNYAITNKIHVLSELIEISNRAQVFLRNNVLRLFDINKYFDNVKDASQLRERVVSIKNVLRSKYEETSKIINNVTMGIDKKTETWLRERLLDSEKAKLFIKELEPLVEDYKKSSDEIKRVMEDIEFISSKLKELEKELEILSYDEKVFEEHRRLLEEAQRRHTDIYGHIQKLEEKTRNLEVILKERKTEIDGIKMNLSELRAAKEKLLVLLKIRKLYHRDYIPSRLRVYAIARINDEFNSLLQSFNLTYREAYIDDNINVILRSGSTTLSLSQLSGGEKIVVALSFLLALRKTVEELLFGKKVFGFLVLDEPTIYLDEDRRASLIELLKEFQGGRIIPQLIIVTHEEDLKESGDNIILVENNGFTSTTKIIYGNGDLE